MAKPPANRTTPARARTAPAEPDTDVTDITYDDEAGTFTARVLDDPEPFLFSTDVNTFLFAGATSPDMEGVGAMRRLVMSLVLVPGADELDGDELEAARIAERQRFTRLLESQSGFTWERFGRLMGDLIAAAGKEDTSK